jgi:putative spermidine/putrescine transport system substrate-binding protein
MTIRHDASRRRFLGSAAALAGAALTPGLAAAQQAARLVVNTYPGIYEEAFRAILVPALKKANIEITVQPILVVDMVARILAARNNPPYDVTLFDEGPLLNVLKEDILAKFPADRSQYFKDLPAAFHGFEETGPVVTVQPIGIAYNPKKVPAPKSWDDLWRPEYKGKVGLTGMQSSLGTAYMCEIAKLHGGGEKDFEPAFKRMRTLLPNVASIAPSPGALATLLQQGEVDLAPNYYNAVMLLKSRGVDVDFVIPGGRPVMIRTTMNIIKNTKNMDAAVRYVDTMLSPDVQQAFMDRPFFCLGTSTRAVFPKEMQAVFGANVNEALKRGVILDWATINRIRPELIARFNKEIRV